MGASWALPNVITVAASNSNDTLASFSNFGPGVEVAAPGGVGVGISGGEGGIWSTLLKRCGPFGLLRCSDYGQKLGTSMAAPMVAGLAGLACSANPSMSAADVGSCIVSTAGTGTATITVREHRAEDGRDAAGTCDAEDRLRRPDPHCGRIGRGALRGIRPHTRRRGHRRSGRPHGVGELHRHRRSRRGTVIAGPGCRDIRIGPLGPVRVRPTLVHRHRGDDR